MVGVRKGKGKGIEGAKPRAREEGGGEPSSLAHSRAPKFPLPLPLLTPATQASILYMYSSFSLSRNKYGTKK